MKTIEMTYRKNEMRIEFTSATEGTVAILNKPEGIIETSFKVGQSEMTGETMVWFDISDRYFRKYVADTVQNKAKEVILAN